MVRLYVNICLILFSKYIYSYVIPSPNILRKSKVVFNNEIKIDESTSVLDNNNNLISKANNRAMPDISHLHYGQDLDSEMLVFSQRLIIGWQDALKGNLAEFENIIANSSVWENSFVSKGKDLKEGFIQFSNFFTEPCLLVFSIKQTDKFKLEVDYQISFWYPMLWRPRIIIPAKAEFIVSEDYQSLISAKENWEVSVADIFLKQLPPRFWDLWHVFCSPSPEYPPMKIIGSVDKVNFIELPRTIAIEAIWSGPAKFPGPPLLVIPGFSMFGYLRTSRPKRDPFYTVLPVEVQSSRYFSTKYNEDMKRSSWIFHVPTALQPLIYEKAISEEVFPLEYEYIAKGDGVTAEDDLVAETDYQVGLENISVMKSIKAGAVRGDFKYNVDSLDEFEEKESKSYRYRILPKRIVAAVDIYGEANPESISSAIQNIKKAINDRSKEIFKNCNVSISRKTPSLGKDADAFVRVGEGAEGGQTIGLQLCNIKGCFNMNGEPVMAIYEMQYNKRHTRVFLELDLSSSY